MVIGGDDVSNDVITLFKCLHSRLFLLHFTPIGRNLTAHSTGSHSGIGCGIKIPET